MPILQKCLCLFVAVCLSFSHAQEMLDSTQSIETSDFAESSAQDLNAVLDSSQNPYYYHAQISHIDNRAKYLAISSGMLLGGTLIGAGALYLMPESVTNWNRDDINNLGTKWRNRVKSAPVVDKDDWFLNWITHPYWGAVYYMQPRYAGYSYAESVLYSFIFSTCFWEFGVEAFAEIPSWQDLIITPAIGSIFGELFYQATMHIHSQQDTIFGSRILGKSALLVMDPVGFIMRDLGLAKFAKLYNATQTNSLILPSNQRDGSVGVRLMVLSKF